MGPMGTDKVGCGAVRSTLWSSKVGLPDQACLAGARLNARSLVLSWLVGRVRVPCYTRSSVQRSVA